MNRSSGRSSGRSCTRSARLRPTVTPDERWVSVMGEVNGARLDAPAWGYAQVWSTEELCREHAWSMQCVGRRFYEGLEVRRVRVVGAALFRLA